MTTGDGQGAKAAEIEAARILLARMGIAPKDLVQAAGERSLAPTFAEGVPLVSEAVSAGVWVVLKSDSRVVG